MLVIVGDISTLKLSKLVFDYFGAIPPSDNLPLDQDLTIKSFQKDLTDNEEIIMLRQQLLNGAFLHGAALGAGHYLLGSAFNGSF